MNDSRIRRVRQRSVAAESQVGARREIAMDRLISSGVNKEEADSIRANQKQQQAAVLRLTATIGNSRRPSIDEMKPAADSSNSLYSSTGNKNFKSSPLLVSLVLFALASASTTNARRQLSAAADSSSRWHSSRAGGGGAERGQGEPAEATCSFPGSPAHASLTYNASQLVPGTTASYTCHPGYQLLGPGRRVCQPDGGWLPAALPVCAHNGTAFGELLAVGAISPTRTTQDEQLTWRAQPEAGRLVDRIASAAIPAVPSQELPPNKLDYIIDFMRNNKLTKFCDLLARKEPEILQLNQQLNRLNQFTLFVPTNEALNLMPPDQLELVSNQQSELRKFLMSHVTTELVVPKLNLANVRESLMSYQWRNSVEGRFSGTGSVPRQQRQLQASASSTNLVFSLAGNPLRVTTAAFQSNAPARQNLTTQALQTGSEPKGTKLELIVNGANVLTGQSYALQEPNNSSITYAIVHLIDRPLYPSPNQTVLEKIRSLAPRMFHYLELSKDLQLLEALDSMSGRQASNQRLATFFLPTDDSFKVVPAKLLAQLETNQTFLANFLKNHLLEGLHYSGQLAPAATRLDESRPGSVRLSALSNLELEFETKTLQSRSLLLVNSVPILEPDIMTLNGVIHQIGRPILERRLLEGCNCNEPASNNSTNQLWPTRRIQPEGLKPNVAYEFDENNNGNAANNRVNLGGELTATGNELEREESSLEPARNPPVRLRSQRSGNLPVGQNNRDFYRPSAAPANLLLTAQPETQAQPAPRIELNQSGQILMNRNELNNLLLSGGGNQSSGRVSGEQLSFDDNRYKVVLNATSRQRMREKQRLTALNSDSLPSSSAVLFSYDRPLTDSNSTDAATQTGSGAAGKRTYSTIQANSTGASTFTEPANSWFSAPYNIAAQEDRLNSEGSSNRQQRLLKFKPEEARDWDSALSSIRATMMRQQSFNQDLGVSNRTGKQQVDTVGKTTTAPGGFAGCAFYDTQCKRLVGKLVRLPPNSSRGGQLKQQASMLASASAPARNSLLESPAAATTPLNLDSTFGETTTQRSIKIQTNQTHRVAGPRVSPLNQPLPPWSEEEGHLKSLAGSAQSWRAQDADISRIKTQLPAGYANGISRETSKSLNSGQKQVSSKTAQVSPFDSFPAAGANLSSRQNPPLETPIYLNPSPFASIVAGNKSARLTFNSQQYHTPTPYSVSLATTHLPGMFNSNTAGSSSPLGRLTNFTAFETYPPDELPQFDKKQEVNNLVNRMRLPTTSQVRSPVELVPAGFRLQETSKLTNGSSLDSIKQARKIVRLQSGFQQGPEEFVGNNADISITSARLNSTNLATQASDQAPNVNFVRSAPLNEPLTNSNELSNPSADFFQDRTIAEIIDDSGLRIDGQQVTFGRLKECLADAELLSLVSQTGNALTIFMPTDLAFQRLVQQQAVVHQQRLQQIASGPSNLDRNLLPLVANMKLRALPVGDTTLGSLDNSGLLATNSSPLHAAERLTLDCSSPQVRQLLLDHLSARLVTPKQLQADTSIGSLSGKQLLLSSFPSKKIVMVDGQPVIAATRAKNGMVYVINKFLNLTQQVPNVMSLIETQPNLKTFASYLQFSSLADRLKRETGPITILAPTNEAFEQLSSAARQLINSDPAALTDILRGHIVDGAQFGKLISMRNSLRTLNSDQSIEAKVIKPNVYLLDNQMTSIKLVGTTGNGVVNSVDRLIVPSWLKVSLGNGGRMAASIPETSNSLPTGNSSLFVGEIDSTSISGSGGGPRNSPLNLPSIGDKPTRFEQPGSRLFNNNPNSFLFANTTTNNNNLDSFDFTRPPATETSLLSSATARSPFLKVATNFSSSSLGDQSRGFQATRTQQPTGNVSRNMMLIEKLANLMQTSKFIKYLLRSRVSELLKQDMNYVILIPTDQAIEKLPRQIIDMLERDQERLNDLINYHVLDTTFEYINTIPDGQTLNTLNEKDILFNWHRNNTILTASGAVVMGGIQEDNIALLIVDRVLYPTPGDLLNIVAKSPILSNFTSIIREAKLDRQLSLAGPFTLFAPSDFAFNQLPRRDLEFLQRDRDTARRFLLRHLSQPAIFTSSIALSNQTISGLTNNPGRGVGGGQANPGVPTMIINNLLGEDLSLRQRNDYFSVNDVNFSYADVAATNGVVHVIDGLL